MGGGCEEGKRGFLGGECCVGWSAMREGDLATSARDRGQAGRTSQPLRVAPASWDDFLGHTCLLASQVTEAGPALIRGNMAYETGRALWSWSQVQPRSRLETYGRGALINAEPARLVRRPWMNTLGQARASIRYSLVLK